MCGWYWKITCDLIQSSCLPAKIGSVSVYSVIYPVSFVKSLTLVGIVGLLLKSPLLLSLNLIVLELYREDYFDFLNEFLI